MSWFIDSNSVVALIAFIYNNSVLHVKIHLFEMSDIEELRDNVIDYNN